MADYIRREDARRMVVQLDKYAWQSPVSDERRVTVDVDLVKFGLDRIPAVDVAEVVHGKWIPCDNGGYYCSHCDTRIAFRLGKYFCNNCGAKMDGGDGSVADDLERKLAETGKLVPRLYGDYVFSPCQNAFNGKTSWWLSKKNCTVAIYCFTAGTTAEVDAQLSVGGGQAYIQMFEERTGGRHAGC